LSIALSEQRLVKDDFEIAQFATGVSYTVKGFEDVVRALPTAQGRGERVIEASSIFARAVEATTLATTHRGERSHATTLHWTRNDGEVRAATSCCSTPASNATTSNRRRHAHHARERQVLPAQRRVYELVCAPKRPASPR